MLPKPPAASARTASEWRKRYREGDQELRDRSSRPRHSPSSLAAEPPPRRRLVAERGVHVRAVMSDNGSCYVAHEYAHALRQLSLHHLHIKAGRPHTNGKAERFVQTLLREWAYAQIYGSSDERTTNLPRFLKRYNYRRPHGSLGKQVPASRLNNLVRNYT